MDSSPTQDSSRGDRALEAWEEAQLATHLDMYDALALSGCDDPKVELRDLASSPPMPNRDNKKRVTGPCALMLPKNDAAVLSGRWRIGPSLQTFVGPMPKIHDFEGETTLPFWNGIGVSLTSCTQSSGAVPYVGLALRIPLAAASEGGGQHLNTGLEHDTDQVVEVRFLPGQVSVLLEASRFGRRGGLSPADPILFLTFRLALPDEDPPLLVGLARPFTGNGPELTSFFHGGSAHEGPALRELLSKRTFGVACRARQAHHLISALYRMQAWQDDGCQELPYSRFYDDEGNVPLRWNENDFFARFCPPPPDTPTPQNIRRYASDEAFVIVQAFGEVFEAMPVVRDCRQLQNTRLHLRLIALRRRDCDAEDEPEHYAILSPPPLPRADAAPSRNAEPTIAQRFPYVIGHALESQQPIRLRLEGTGGLPDDDLVGVLRRGMPSGISSRTLAVQLRRSGPTTEPFTRLGLAPLHLTPNDVLFGCIADASPVPVRIMLSDPSTVARARFEAVTRLLERPTAPCGPQPPEHGRERAPGDERRRAARNVLRILSGQPIPDLWYDDFLPVGMSTAIRDAVAETFGPRGRREDLDYLGRVPCGVYVAEGPAGAGKSRLGALLSLACASQGQTVLAVAPGHASASSLAEEMSRFTEQLGMDVVVVRAFDAASDLTSIKLLAAGTSWEELPHRMRRSFQPSQWHADHSISYWLAVLLGLTPVPDHVARIRSFFESTFVIWVRDSCRRSSLPANELAGLLMQILCDLLRDHVGILCTTTSWSRERHVDSFTRRSHVLFADEAHAMTAGELLVSLGPWQPGPLRPCEGPATNLPSCLKRIILACDQRQPGPRCRSCHVRLPTHPPCGRAAKEELPANPFEGQYRTAAAVALMQDGWPTVLLREQHRTVAGAYDMVNDVFYPQRAVACSGARPFVYWDVVQSWLQQVAGVRPVSPRRSSPAMIALKATVCVRVDGPVQSRANPAAWDFLEDHLLRSILPPDSTYHVPAEHLLIVAPFAGMVDYIHLGLDGPAFAAIDNRLPETLKKRVCTPEEARGKEARVVFFLTTVTRDTGPGLLAEPRRLYLACTRHIEALVLIGDPNVVPEKRRKTTSTSHDDGHRGTACSRLLGKLFAWLRKRDRIGSVPVSNFTAS